MSKILFILLTLFLFSCDSEPDINNPKHWSYEIHYKIESTDSIKPIGRIEFSRTKSIKDKLREETYNENWYPSMVFDIYNISDLKYCKEISRKLKMFSSCLDSHLGGDLIINNNYIFYNNSGCLNCTESENEIDYCRPVTNKILSELNLTQNSTLKDIDSEIGMKLKRNE
ncbi:hypothetical protein [Hyunsoonleella pacifica]|uniref:Uncharacterized protein n=1 Tax=Hyunsoonleella pacifica TaxID=1080224 RepID=A0A4Q9FQ04_9FLAO|nr:hypothetical protein [Hyunsoonleella pacifica]TBN17565.1 hypothetical protein EYD46_04420 [Hyunsoonleella pacifica]GGD10849.1 hypothetical protein GCM10011368_11030 [Hyunsoonleella pacifica]